MVASARFLLTGGSCVVAATVDVSVCVCVSSTVDVSVAGTTVVTVMKDDSVTVTSLLSVWIVKLGNGVTVVHMKA